MLSQTYISSDPISSRDGEEPKWRNCSEEGNGLGNRYMEPAWPGPHLASRCAPSQFLRPVRRRNLPGRLLVFSSVGTALFDAVCGRDDGPSRPAVSNRRSKCYDLPVPSHRAFSCGIFFRDLLYFYFTVNLPEPPHSGSPPINSISIFAEVKPARALQM